MKKLMKSLTALVLAFVAVLSVLSLTACGEEKPYSVVGLTLNGTKNCVVVWGEDVTNQDKERFYDEIQLSTKSDGAVKDYFETNYGELMVTVVMTFNEDGTLTYSSADKSRPITYYYVQSQDLNSVALYRNEEHTIDVDGMKVDFINGKYCLCITSLESINLQGIYFELVKA